MVRLPVLRFSTVAAAVLGGLLVVNVALNIRQQRDLRRLQGNLRQAQEQLAARRFVPGDLLDHVEVIDSSGMTRTLAARENGVITIVVVHPACDSCAVTARELRRAKPARAPWVISLGNREQTARFAAEHQLGGIYLLSPRNYPIVRQKFSAIPQIVRVDSGLVARTCDSVAACL